MMAAPTLLSRRPAARCRRARFAVLLGALVFAGPAGAQLGLPGPGSAGGLSGPAGLGGLGGIGSGLPVQFDRLPPRRLVEPIAAAVPLQLVRRRAIDDLLSQHADELEPDPAGEPVVRAELLLLSPSAGLLEAALNRGFRLLRERSLDGLDLRSVVLQPPAGLSTAEALALLRAIDPQLDADFNHVHSRSGAIDAGAVSPAMAVPVGSQRRRVGLIDGGVEMRHPALRSVDRQLWGCDGKPIPSPHGTAVASLLVGRDSDFSGVLSSSTLYAADVYCGRATGGSVELVAQALAWMVRERVSVINVSLVGPANKLLEKVVRAVLEKGHLVVAAVGNDGPTAPALYPAAYPDVVGVTGVGRNRTVLPEAAQGRQVVFAAPGAEIAVARSSGSGYGAARGTSFAAPLIAGLLADSLQQPDRAAASLAVQALARQAIDLGAPGRDTVYGFGLLGEQARFAAGRLP